MHGIGGISRSGRVRKKSAKLMEMEDFNVPEKEERPYKKSKSSDDSEQETEKKVVPLKLPIKVPLVTISVPPRKSPLLIPPTKQIFLSSEKKKHGLESPTKNLNFNTTSPKLVNKSVIFPVVTSKFHGSALTSGTSSSSSSESDDSFEEVPAPEVFRQIDQRLLPPKKKINQEMLWEKPVVTFGIKKLSLDAESPPLKKKKKKKMKKKLEKEMRGEKLKEKKKKKKTSVSSKSFMGCPVTLESILIPKTQQFSKSEEVLSRKSKSSVCGVSKSTKNVTLVNGKKVKDPSKVRPMSAYMLWCRENRKRIVRENPQLDFHLISKKMGAVWQSLSAKEKMAWKRKAKQSAKLQKNALAKGVTFISTGKSGSALGQFASSGGGANRNQSNVTNISSICDPKTKLPRTTPLDVAAHLKLLGDSLSIIGQRLTEHEGQIAVSGTLSVLLDSTLCALGPLMCLTSQVPELNGCEQKSLAQTLDNIAYVMPGL